MIRPSVAVLAWSLLLTPAASTFAQTDDSTINAADRREAKRLFNQGHLAYRRGDYEEAILKWLRSHELSKEPLIFESIANAYERLGDYAAALDYLSRWRDKAPRKEQAPLDERIENLKRRVGEQKDIEKKRKAEEEKRKREREESKKREDAYRRQLDDKSKGEDGGGLNTVQIVGWSLVGVGGVAVLTGVALDIAAAVKRPDEDAACVDQDGRHLCREQDRDAIVLTNTLAIAGDATWIAGLAIAAAGGGILLWQAFGAADEGDAVNGALVPWLAPGIAGASVTARY